MTGKLPISVLIMAKNEQAALPRCLAALKDFDEVIVVDSHSSDQTAQSARDHGARVEQFSWNGRYPKKSQWALENVKTRHNWVFLVDADEIITPDLVEELRTLDFSCAGYFVRGQYVWLGSALHHGTQNNKLCLFDKNKMAYPEIDDLDITQGWEMEMHYQPVLKDKSGKIGQVNAPLLHYACDDYEAWLRKHEFYARWEAAMILKEAFPKDPSPVRESLKKIFRRLPRRDLIAFVHSYIFKLGFLDGRAGLDFALARARYYKMISAALSSASKAPEKQGAAHIARSAP